MMIAWVYLDKEAASVNALKDYAAMQHIIDSYNDDVKESRAFLTALPVPSISAMPGKSTPNVHGGERQLSAAIDRIDVIKERHRRAIAYMDWFGPAWDALTDREKHLLESFFLNDELTRAEIVSRLCEEMKRERSSVYRAKDKALGRLALLLYGK